MILIEMQFVAKNIVYLISKSKMKENNLPFLKNFSLMAKSNLLELLSYLNQIRKKIEKKKPKNIS